jgi:nucleotidyltransferase-like protein
VTQTATLYGFGSHFSGTRTGQSDIDLLIVHANVGAASIRFAIQCKRLFVEALPSAHVVMLSEEEDRDLAFRQRSKASLLGLIVEDRASDQIRELTGRIVNA